MAQGTPSSLVQVTDVFSHGNRALAQTAKVFASHLEIHICTENCDYLNPSPVSTTKKSSSPSRSVCHQGRSSNLLTKFVSLRLSQSTDFLDRKPEKKPDCSWKKPVLFRNQLITPSFLVVTMKVTVSENLCYHNQLIPKKIWRTTTRV